MEVIPSGWSSRLVTAVPLPMGPSAAMTLRLLKPSSPQTALLNQLVSPPQVLDRKLAVINGLQSRLKHFKAKLNEEETLNMSFSAGKFPPSKR